MARRWRVIFCWFIVALPTWAQSSDTCTVLKWETKTYSQSAHITRNHPVYWVNAGGVTYQIGRRTTAVEMQTGQQIKCRVDGGHMLVENEKGKETKYDVLGSEPSASK